MVLPGPAGTETYTGVAGSKSIERKTGKTYYSYHSNEEAGNLGFFLRHEENWIPICSRCTMLCVI
jgi:hypothetical protein